MIRGLLERFGLIDADTAPCGTVSDTAGVGVEGRITLRKWSPDVLRREIKAYDVLDDDELLQRINQLDDELADTIDTTNIAVDGLLEFIPRALDPTADVSATASHIALGTATDTPQASNTTLGNEVYRTQLGDAEPDGTDLLASAVITQTEANGYNVTEVGLAGGPTEGADSLLTHALLDAADQFDKNTQMVVTINYVLEFRRPA